MFLNLWVSVAPRTQSCNSLTGGQGATAPLKVASIRAAGEMVKVFTVDIVNQVARRPPKPSTGGQAVTAQLIFESI